MAGPTVEASPAPLPPMPTLTDSTYGAFMWWRKLFFKPKS
jgi:hypothetical protein